MLTCIWQRLVELCRRASQCQCQSQACVRNGFVCVVCMRYYCIMVGCMYKSTPPHKIHNSRNNNWACLIYYFDSPATSFNAFSLYLFLSFVMSWHLQQSCLQIICHIFVSRRTYNSSSIRKKSALQQNPGAEPMNEYQNSRCTWWLSVLKY